MTASYGHMTDDRDLANGDEVMGISIARSCLRAGCGSRWKDEYVP
jgi:hypothetical protein